MAMPPPTSRSLPVVDDFDAANQALADALRKSFGLLKWIMTLVVVLYLLSGVFQVKSGERGYIVRLGQIAARDLGPGWHWSWPFPIDEARTMSTQGERAVTVPFMFQMSEQQRLKGVTSGGSTLLRPGRDNYLVTGDLNILHAELIAQYVITNSTDYLTYTLDETPNDKNPSEHAVLSQILAVAATEVAASRGVDDVYKDRDGYQRAVCDRMNERLETLAKSRAPIGLSVRRVITTAYEGFEAIMPPLGIRPDFEAVVASEQKKGQTITEARGKAEEELSRTAGTDHAALAAAIDAEFLALRTKEADARDKSAEVEKLLLAASGEVRSIIKQAESRRDKLANEAAGDANAVRSLAAEYAKNPELVKSRMMQSLWQRLMATPSVHRQYVPSSVTQLRLQVPRDQEQQEKALKAREALEKKRREQPAKGVRLDRSLAM